MTSRLRIFLTTLALFTLCVFSGCTEDTAEQNTVVSAGDVRPERVSFNDLDIGIQPDIVFRPWMLSETAHGLEGHKIRIGGYILPDNQLENISEFVLLKNTQCKFGPGGQADHLIMVTLKEGVTTSFKSKPVDVVGILEISPVTGPDGNTWSIYELEAESVAVTRR